MKPYLVYIETQERTPPPPPAFSAPPVHTPAAMNVEAPEGAKKPTVNALVVRSVGFITCNVAALTFYATIYEDIRCICNNKSREK